MICNLFNGVSFWDLSIFYFLIYCLVIFMIFLVVKRYWTNVNYPTILIISLIISFVLYYLNYLGVLTKSNNKYRLDKLINNT